ncbi:MAG: endosialidase [Lachnospiraceae bacterium]|nr:endosialidase [Lachnospiraceae bacterium]NLC74815.1 endosialidase [Clostridiales bacterium]
MSGIKGLIRKNEDGTLSFGDNTLEEKTKKDGFEFEGGLYKVKTYKDITRLECNESFVYESDPGTVVSEFEETENGMKFNVDGAEDADITVGLADETPYEVIVDGRSIGTIETNLSGKLSFSVELGDKDRPVAVEIRK